MEDQILTEYDKIIELRKNNIKSQTKEGKEEYRHKCITEMFKYIIGREMSEEEYKEYINKFDKEEKYNLKTYLVEKKLIPETRKKAPKVIIEIDEETALLLEERKKQKAKNNPIE